MWVNLDVAQTDYTPSSQYNITFQGHTIEFLESSAVYYSYLIVDNFVGEDSSLRCVVQNCRLGVFLTRAHFIENFHWQS